MKMIDNKYELGKEIIYRNVKCRIIAVKQIFIKSVPTILYDVKEIKPKGIIGPVSWCTVLEDNIEKHRTEENYMADMYS